MRHKNLIGISLAILLFFAFIIPDHQLSAKANEAQTPYQTEVELLQNLQILPKSFDGEKQVKRSEFAVMVAKIMHPVIAFSPSDTLPDAFTDVKSNHKYYGEIRSLKDLGIISGDMFSNFYPDDIISYQDAVTMLINALGYGKYAQKKGGYPTGYYNIAQETGILRNAPSGEVTFYKAAKLIYNSLFVDVMSIAGITADSETMEILEGKNVLSQRLGIEEYDGVILSDGHASLNGEEVLNSDEILFRDIKTENTLSMLTGNSQAYSYLGYRVRLFAKEDKTTGKSTVIYCVPHRSVKVITIAADSIISAQTDYIEYEDEKNSDKYRKLSFGKKAMYVTVNGMKKSSYTTEDLKPKEGYITLIDNGDSKIANHLAINSFDYNLVVDQVNSAAQVIQCLQSPRNNIDYSDKDAVSFRIYKNGSLIEPEALNRLDILSVAKSAGKVNGKTLYTAYVGDQSGQGKVEGLIPEENIVIVNGQQLGISKLYLDLKPNLMGQLRSGSEISYSLDATGKIAYIGKMSSDGRGFAYLIDMQQESGLEDEILLRYYSAEGEICTQPVSSKITVDAKKPDGFKIDGTKANSLFEELQDMLCLRPDGTVTIPERAETESLNKNYTSIVPRPAIVKQNADKKIVSIDTDALTYDDASMEQSDPAALKAGVRVPRLLSYSMNGRTFDGSFFLTGETIILKVPDVDRYHMQEEIARNSFSKYSKTATNLFEQDLSKARNYQVLTSAQLSNRMEYDIQAYNVDPYTGVAEFAVVRGSVGYMQNKVPYQSPFYMFLKRTSCFDEQSGELMDKIYYSQNGQEKSMVVDPDILAPWYKNLIYGGKTIGSIVNAGQPNETVTYNEVEPLKQGDIIYAEETDGKLSHIQRDLNMSLINSKTCGSARASMPVAPYTNTFYAKTNIDCPFDQRVGPSFNYESTYNMMLSAAMDLNGTALKVRVPARGTTSQIGNFAEYIGNENAAFYLDRYIDIAAVNIRVIEEIECDVEHDGCRFREREGTAADLKTASMYSGDLSTDGIYKASRIYSMSTYGVYTQMIIINFSEKHSKYVR